MDYKIGSFNLHNIGVSALGEKNQRNLRIIANIIESENFDIIALQEVLSEGKAFISKDYTKKCILNELGGEDKWGFEWADATNDDFGGLNNDATNKDSRGEGYAFIWNKSRIRLCSTEVFTPNGPIERKFYPRMLNQMKTEMFRKPFYGRFTSADVNGGAFVEFRLICIHTYYGKSDNSESRMIRQREIDNVLKEIYPLMCDKRYGNNMPAYTIVLGDYNAEVWTSESKKWQEPLKIERGGKRPAIMITDDNGEVVTERHNNRRIKTVQTELTTLKTKNNENNEEQFDTAGYACNYDHFSYEEDKFKGVGVKNHRVTRAVSEYCKLEASDSYQNNFEKYYKAVSDHIPIMMELNFKL